MNRMTMALLFVVGVVVGIVASPCDVSACTPTPPPPATATTPPTLTPPATFEPTPTEVPGTRYGAVFLGGEPQEAYERLRAAGGRVAALRVFWPDMSQADWEWADSMVEKAESADLEPWLVVWFGGHGSDGGSGGCSEGDPAQAVGMFTQLVARYQGRVTAYSLGSEVDGCADDLYWQRMAMAWYAIQENDPDADLVLSLAHDRFRDAPMPYWPAGPFKYDFLDRLMNELDGEQLPCNGCDICFPCLDGVAVSAFDDFRGNWSPPGVEGKFESVRGQLQSSADLSVLGGGLPRAPSDEWTERNERLQAAGVMRVVDECARAGAKYCVLYRAWNADDEAWQFGVLDNPVVADAFASAVGAVQRGEPVPYPDWYSDDGERLGAR